MRGAATITTATSKGSLCRSAARIADKKAEGKPRESKLPQLVATLPKTSRRSTPVPTPFSLLSRKPVAAAG